MITATNHSMYSINRGAEMAYQIDYSEGSQVRAVVSKDKIIRKEFKTNGEWKQAGKSYVVSSNKKRQAEKICKSVIEALKG
jgi:hypothetical protein